MKFLAQGLSLLVSEFPLSWHK